MTMKLKLSIPELRITGQYKTSGRIFVLAVEGSGTFWNILSNDDIIPLLTIDWLYSFLVWWTGNVTVVSTSNLVLKGNPPNQNLQVANNNLDLTVGKMRMRLNNLFNGDPILGNSKKETIETTGRMNRIIACQSGETVNNFLNENSQEVFNEVKPEMAKQVGELVIKVMNDALGSLPADKFVSSRRTWTNTQKQKNNTDQTFRLFPYIDE